MMECLPFFLSDPGTQYSKSGEGDLKKRKGRSQEGRKTVKEQQKHKWINED